MDLAEKLLAGGAGGPAHQLAAHVARGRGAVRAYADTLVALEEASADAAVLARHRRHAASVLSRVRSGVPQEQVCARLLAGLREDVEGSGGDMDFLMDGHTHKQFVAALEKEYKVEVHHFDEVGNGVYVYLDAENNALLRDALTDAEALDTVAEELGYLLLRRGTRDDVEYGGFGDDLARWIFVQRSRPKSGPEDQEGETFTVKQLRNLEKALESLEEPEPRVLEIRHHGRAYAVEARGSEVAAVTDEAGHRVPRTHPAHREAEAVVAAEGRLVRLYECESAYALARSWPVAGPEVDGRRVMDDGVANTSSIGASLDNWETLPGLREVPMSAFHATGTHYSVRGAARIQELAAQIRSSQTIAPLIVVVDATGPYVLEGATRLEALHLLGAVSFPALVVVDLGGAD